MKLLKNFLICLPMLFITYIFILHGVKFPDSIANIIVFLFANIIFFLMVNTGKTNKYRTILFSAVALIFPIGFIFNLIAERGAMSFNMANIIECKIPFCHIVIPMLIIPAALTKTIIFPGQIISTHASIASMIILLLCSAIVMGRGWCSWACFFGGFDETFSKIKKHPILKITNKMWLYTPYAVLFLVVFASAYLLDPFYCAWLCPFKAVTEFSKVTSFEILLQTIIFVSLFISLVIVLPILTKKRTQCGLFCPMGPFLSVFNIFNIFEIRIDKEKCSKCKKCINSCPLFALDENSILKGNTKLTCAKCAKCVDECPKQAITFHIKGTPLFLKTETARVLFMYPAHLLLSIFGGNIIINSLNVIQKIFLGPKL